MVIAIAPDKFKGTLTSAEAAEAIARGIRRRCPDALVRKIPMADGGEGTAAALGAAYGWKQLRFPAHNSAGEDIEGICYVSNDGRRCVIDSSAVIGLQGAGRNPWLASSYYLGEAVRYLTDRGIAGISIGIGGTATVDAGLGFLQALGAEIRTSEGVLTRPFRASDLLSLISVDLSGLPSPDTFLGLADVDVPLCDNDGYPSMLMFAPQKGVEEDSLIILKMGLDRLYEYVRWTPFVPDLETRFGGAGGGLGFAVAGAIGAPVEFGAEAVMSAGNVFEPRPDIVITGEGSYDAQSLAGKAADMIMKESAVRGIRCVILAGKVDPRYRSRDIIQTSPEGIVPTPMQAAEYLETAAEQIL